MPNVTELPKLILMNVMPTSNNPGHAYSYELSREQILICNYGPAGNVPGEPLYKIGEPCSNCPSDTSTCVNGICAWRQEDSVEEFKRRTIYLSQGTFQNCCSNECMYWFLWFIEWINKWCKSNIWLFTDFFFLTQSNFKNFLSETTYYAKTVKMNYYVYFIIIEFYINLHKIEIR